MSVVRGGKIEMKWVNSCLIVVLFIEIEEIIRNVIKVLKLLNMIF